MDLSVVLPCFNERLRLPSTLDAVRGFLDRRGDEYEIVLVDDGSDDGTLDLLRAYERGAPNIRVVSLWPNQGKGRAVAEGMRVTRGARVLMADADLSTPMVELERLEDALDTGADVAIGSRSAPGSEMLDQAFYRVVMGRTFNLLVRRTMLPDFRDTQCGFKLFQGEAARELFRRLRTSGFAFDVEILWDAQGAGYTVTEVPVRWRASDSSRVAPLRHSGQMLRDLVRLRMRLR
ncbi:MAG: glycosyltransferase family 2 protein [Candidatus Dormibacteraeota bacterium]|nr:glycosyltransferase family 2 protein [Candidatus Dormibacteraeota bacterium]MBO0762661.1 glycosyltransferase family 2 protein [Candidatus Dormibacteraeota bacterium]